VGWEMKRGAGPYFYRARWVNGRRVIEYLGKGPAAEMAAENERRERHERDEACRAWEEETRAGPADRLVREVQVCCGGVTRASLIVAGFYQHDQGEWRRRRERHD
jgi:hypothetical protein